MHLDLQGHIQLKKKHKIIFKQQFYVNNNPKRLFKDYKIGYFSGAFNTETNKRRLRGRTATPTNQSPRPLEVIKFYECELLSERTVSCVARLLVIKLKVVLHVTTEN